MILRVFTNRFHSIKCIIFFFCAVNPIITSFVPDNGRYAVDVGDPVTFICNASGIPPPSIQWYRGGQLFNPSMDSRLVISSEIITAPLRSLATVGRTLTVSSVMAYDTDTRYSCNAVNEAGVGMTSAEFELIVEGTYIIIVPSKLLPLHVKIRVPAFGLSQLTTHTLLRSTHASFGIATTLLYL